MSASDHLPHHGCGQLLFNLVGLGLVDECRNGDRLDVGWKSDGMASGMVAAGSAEEQRHHQDQYLRFRNGSHHPYHPGPEMVAALTTFRGPGRLRHLAPG